VVALGTVSFVVLLALLKSVIHLARGIFKALNISQEKSHLTPKSVAFILTRRVFLVSLLAFLIALLISTGAIFLSVHFFSFKIDAIYPRFYTAAFIVLIAIIVFSIMSSIRVTLAADFAPIAAYFSKKKGYGYR
jgi:hypothetical protein